MPGREGVEAHGVSDLGRAAGPPAVEDGHSLEAAAVQGRSGEVLEEDDRAHGGIAEVEQAIFMHGLH